MDERPQYEPHQETVAAAIEPPVDLAAEPRYVGDERTTLTEFLDYYRSVLLRKAAGLTPRQLATSFGASTLTIGGLLKHMALVEQSWFGECWLGEPAIEPWVSVDWTATPDWDFESAAHDTPQQLSTLFTAAVERSRAAIEGCNDLDATVESRQRTISLRWILVHMIEEYARHCGHADLLRESIDGSTGD
jgi:uncharacterized damage-inducible protein DinB